MVIMASIFLSGLGCSAGLFRGLGWVGSQKMDPRPCLCCCSPAINFSSDCYSDLLHVWVNLTHKYELTYHCLLVTLAYNGILYCSTCLQIPQTLGGDNPIDVRPLSLRGRVPPSEESPPMHTTNTATESSLSKQRFIHCVNLCRHLPNHSRNARIK